MLVARRVTHWDPTKASKALTYTIRTKVPAIPHVHSSNHEGDELKNTCATSNSGNAQETKVIKYEHIVTQIQANSQSDRLDNKLSSAVITYR